MKIYLATSYGRMHEMREVARKVRAAGHEITSRWIDGNEEHQTERDSAFMDLEDVHRCDCVLSFTHPKGSLLPGGGRHVEFGYGYAQGKRLVIVGDRETVFHHLPDVEVFPDLDQALAYLKDWPGCEAPAQLLMVRNVQF